MSATGPDAMAPAEPTPEAVRRAVGALKDAIDRHLAVIESRSTDADSDSGAPDAAVQEAFDALQAAAETYDDVLFEVYEEVTPFEAGGGDAAPAGVDSLEDTPVVSLYLRRDYAVSDPDALLSAGRAAHQTLAESDGGAPDGEPDHHGAALFQLLAVTGIDGFDESAEGAGLDPLGGTVWLLAAESGGDLDDNPFDDANPERMIFRVNEVVSDEPAG